ncbi:MAG: ATP-binding protein [Clostridia bacterium]|nr:ATP-binding protein [Clostridia bacterium]
MKELVIEAERKNLPKVQGFIDEQLEAASCPALTQIAIDVAVEEIFVNIASYAYSPEIGTVMIQVTVHEDPLSAKITLIDHGRPYNPLEKPDPDPTLTVRQRKKGGLGIYMVKQSMDKVNYEYRDGKNILTIEKILR